MTALPDSSELRGDCVSASFPDPDALRGLSAAFLAGRTESTRFGYQSDLKAFARWLGQGDSAAAINQAIATLLGGDPATANRITLAWRSDQLKEGRAPATINRRLATLRSMAKLARMTGRSQVFIEVGSVKGGAVRETAGPKVGAIRTLFRLLAEATQTPTVRRDSALFGLLVHCALRRTEVAGLRVRDLNVDGDEPFVEVKGKGRHGRQRVTIPSETAGMLRAWMEVHPDPSPDRAAFICLAGRHKGEDMQGSGIYYVCRKWGKKAGIGHLRPHMLRHSAITVALDESGGNLREVARYARHSDPSVTSRYDDSRKDFAGTWAKTVARVTTPVLAIPP